MADNSDDDVPWTAVDENHLLLEISEDRRLVRLGIDPDAHPLTVLLELRKKKQALDAERAARQSTQS
jgi:hypothetical protein